jgi:hypothetical protein
MAAAVILFTVSILTTLVGPQQAAAATVAIHFKTTEVVVQSFSEKRVSQGPPECRTPRKGELEHGSSPIF